MPDMAPYQLRNLIEGDLNEIFRRMTSPEWLDEVDTATPARKKKAALALLDVQLMRLRIRNAQLAALREALSENESRLKSASEGLADALQDLADVSNFLNKVTKVVDVAKRILGIFT